MVERGHLATFKSFRGGIFIKEKERGQILLKEEVY